MNGKPLFGGEGRNTAPTDVLFDKSYWQIRVNLIFRFLWHLPFEVVIYVYRLYVYNRPMKTKKIKPQINLKKPGHKETFTAFAQLIR